MKRIIVLLLVLVLCCSFFASCENLPPEVMESLAPVLEKLGVETEKPEEGPVHEHEFVLTKNTATCTRKGVAEYECACGEKKTEDAPASHSYKVIRTDNPSCTQPGTYRYMCENCGNQKQEKFGAPTGHNVGAFVEYSRLITCTNPNCSYGVWPEGNGKYKDVIVFKFNESDVDRFNTLYAELGEIIAAADAYDASLHAYAPGSATHDAYLVMEAKYEELYDVLEYITAQYQIAQLEYHIRITDEEKEANFDNISKVRTDLVSQFYSYSQAIYDSMYREYYYEGMTDEEITAFIFDSNAVSNPEYKALVDRNNEIELEYDSLAHTNDRVLELYGEFVANNKRIAELLGYENYLAYAYENIYDRDYEYTEVKAIADNVKKYIAPVYNTIYGAWNDWADSKGDSAGTLYNQYTGGSFFSTLEQNKALNDYIDLMNFSAEADKQLSFSDEFNGLMGDGNCFQGLYAGAYVTSLYGMDLPIAYFGGTYSDFFTVSHEFGHYMNEVYSEGKYNQSFDLLEMHSQGNEILFLSYLNHNTGSFSRGGVEFYNIYQNLNMFFVVMNALAVDTFEQAVYTDTYEGTYADTIMADGTITYNEYDLLYQGIVKDFGAEEYMSTDYWRRVTIKAPCYYVSYSVSAISVLQLYPMAMEDFDAASEAYLKLFSYVDEYSEPDAEYMTTEETLLYAGLLSFKDEELYKYINQYFMAMFSED